MSANVCVRWIIYEIPTTKSEREQIYDALFGADDEMSEESANEILQTFGITDEQLVSEFRGLCL